MADRGRPVNASGPAQVPLHLNGASFFQQAGAMCVQARPVIHSSRQTQERFCSLWYGPQRRRCDSTWAALRTVLLSPVWSPRAAPGCPWLSARPLRNMYMWREQQAICPGRQAPRSKMVSCRPGCMPLQPQSNCCVNRACSMWLSPSPEPSRPSVAPLSTPWPFAGGLAVRTCGGTTHPASQAGRGGAVVGPGGDGKPLNRVARIIG